MEQQVRSQLLFGTLAAGQFADIKDDLLEKYQIPESEAVSKRVAHYAGMIGGALQIHMECAILEKKQTFEVIGTMAHLAAVYPFEIFRPYIEEVAQALCPGVQISFGPSTAGRFLAKDMEYSPMTVTLPSEPVLTCPSGLSDQRILRVVKSGGLATGYMRYPHMYQFIQSHSHEMRLDRPANVLLLGAGLIQDPDGSIQCPQLHEIGAIAQCVYGSHGFRMTVFDNDRNLLGLLNENFSLDERSHPIRYDGKAFEFMHALNKFHDPEKYVKLRDDMITGMTIFSKNANVQAVQGDLRDPSHLGNLGKYHLIVGTNSLSNVCRGTDDDSIETKGLIDMIANSISLLNTGGYLFVDEHALKIIDTRLGKGTIDTVIVPLLEYATKSSLSLTLIERPVPKEDGMTVIRSVVREGDKFYKSAIVTHRVYAIQRGAPKNELSIPAVTKLQEHLRTSVKNAKN
ncbi:MAG: hypothetical protein Q8K75_09475 [Chlamydiales bacterium]|nr:hypothetical protein [Chlamydiales bacterium]